MEQRAIDIEKHHYNRKYQEWEAEGTSSRYGIAIRWRAWLPSGTDRWEVEIPPGQITGPEFHGVSSLVFDDPSVQEDVRRELARHREVSVDEGGENGQ